MAVAAAAAAAAPPQEAAKAAVAPDLTVIVYYSRTGNTEKAAKCLEEVLKSRNERVEMKKLAVAKDEHNDETITGYIMSAYWALAGSQETSPYFVLSEGINLEPIRSRIKAVWLCGPVHCWKLCCVLADFVKQEQEFLASSPIELCALATMGKSGENGFFGEIEAIVNKGSTGSAKKELHKKIALKDEEIKGSEEELSQMIQQMLERAQ